eukprot:1357381-Prymnesium_polylepis.1
MIPEFYLTQPHLIRIPCIHLTSVLEAAWSGRALRSRSLTEAGNARVSAPPLPSPRARSRVSRPLHVSRRLYRGGVRAPGPAVHLTTAARAGCAQHPSPPEHGRRLSRRARQLLRRRLDDGRRQPRF